MLRHKRIWLAALVLCLLLSALSAAVWGAEEETVLTEYVDLSDQIFKAGAFSGPTSDPDEAAASSDGTLYGAILAGLETCSKTINIISFNEQIEVVKETFARVLNDHPELFYVGSSFGYSETVPDKIVAALSPIYIRDQEYISDQENFEAAIKEIKAQKKEFDDAVNTALTEALGSLTGEGMNDLQKALALHDYLALNCRYDYGVGNGLTNPTQPNPIFTAYGALVRQNAVCQGYTEAYQYLLSKVGVKAGTVDSKQMNHIWNWVEIGGKRYHVDVTHDDPMLPGAGEASGLSDAPGYVCHDHFLRSDDELYEKVITDNDGNYEKDPHYGFTRLEEATDDTYLSGWVFCDANTPFFWKNGGFYYIPQQEVLFTDTLIGVCSQSIFDHVTAVHHLDAIYYYNDYDENNGGSYGNMNVYRYGLNSHKNESVYTLTEKSTDYGLKIAGDKLQIVLRNGEENPTVVHTITANGNDPLIINVSFDANGGPNKPDDIQVTNGETYVGLPTLEDRSGYSFDGWYTEKTGGDKVTSSTPVTKTTGHTLYAHWTKLENITITPEISSPTSDTTTIALGPSDREILSQGLDSSKNEKVAVIAACFTEGKLGQLIVQTLPEGVTTLTLQAELGPGWKIFFAGDQHFKPLCNMVPVNGV